MGAFNINLAGGLAGLTATLAVIYALTVVLLNIFFAIAVYVDSSRLERKDIYSPGTELVPPWVWVLATLIGGVFVAGIYWLIHRSTLRPAHAVDSESETNSGGI